MAVPGVGAPSSIMVLGVKGTAEGFAPNVPLPIAALLEAPVLLVPMPLMPVPCSCGRALGRGDCR